MRINVNWTTLTIIIIAGFAFATGFLLNFYSDRTEDLKNKITDLEKELKSMESQRNVFINFDLDMANLAQIQLARAQVEILEYRMLNSTYTVLERATKLAIIRTTLEHVFRDLNATYTAQIQARFEFDDYSWLALAERASHGFDYILFREDWEDFPPGSFTSADEFLLGLGTNSTVVGDLFSAYNNTGFPSTQLILDINWDNLYSLHDLVIGKQIDTISLEQINLANTQSISILLSVSVSIATIGTVLSTTMSTRAFEKKVEESFKILRKEVLRADHLEPFPKTKRSKLSILGLIVAFFFAFFGLISAILFLIDPGTTGFLFP
ncbi:MAG: hypothetical protein ACFFFG_07045 [Candidatus Thorarchaeota archaeon]